MNKLLTWLNNHVWPFSRIYYLQRQLDSARSIHDDYYNAAERWHTVARQTITVEQYEEINHKVNLIYVEECARIGALHRQGRDSIVNPVQQTGQIDPKIQGEFARASAEAAKEAQEKSNQEKSK